MDENTIEPRALPGIASILSESNKSFIKVKDNTGKYTTILPITNLTSVLDKNGRTLENYIMEISSSIAASKNDISILYDDADYLNELYLQLQANTNDITDRLAESIEQMNTKLDQTLIYQQELINKIDLLNGTLSGHLDDELLMLNEEE